MIFVPSGVLDRLTEKSSCDLATMTPSPRGTPHVVFQHVMQSVSDTEGTHSSTLEITLHH
jgi:hypothetical protein